MSCLDYSINSLQGVHGITCIENHLLAVLKTLGCPYQAGYVYSYVDISNTILDFYNRKINYTNYDRIDRLQHVYKRMGIVDLVDSNLSCNMMIRKLESEIERGYPLLVHVDPIKLPRVGDILPWRSDHYILLYGIEEDNIYALDDVPKRELLLSRAMLADAFQGDILSINISKVLDLNSFELEINQQINKLRTNTFDKLPYNIENLIPGDYDRLIQFRDALGIIRISRRRIQALFEWISCFYETKNLTGIAEQMVPLITILDRIYSAVEFYRLRKKINFDTIKSQLEEVVKAEVFWMGSLNQA